MNALLYQPFYVSIFCNFDAYFTLQKYKKFFILKIESFEKNMGGVLDTFKLELDA